MDNPDNSKNKVLAQLQAIRKEVFLNYTQNKDPGATCLFYPESVFRVVWDFLLIFFVVYQAFYVPYSICFVISLSSGIRNLEIASITVFLLDIRKTYAAINCNTAIYFQGSLVTKRKVIIFHYLKMWLWLDLLSSVPYTWMTDGVNADSTVSILDGNDASGLLMFIRMFRFLRILRVIRLIKLKALIIKIEDYIASDIIADVFSFARLFIVIFLVAHWIACWFAYVGLREGLDHPDTWESQMDQPLSNTEVYITGLYFAFTTMTTVGYGDVTPYTTGERIFVTFTMILSCGLFAYILGSIGSLVAKQNAEASAYREKVVNLNQYMKKNNLPSDLQFRVRRFLEYIWEKQTKDNVNEREILAALSDPLRDEVYAQVNGAIINICPVYKELDQAYVTQLSKLLMPETYAPGDIIFEQGLLGGKMYYIVHGKIDVYHQSTSSSFKILHTKNYFGEISFFTDMPRCASTRCLEFADVLSLDRTETDKLFEKYPNVKEQIKLLSKLIRDRNDLSSLYIRCYICRSLGHVAIRCRRILLNLDHEEVRSKWLHGRHNHTRYINRDVPPIPNVVRPDRHVSFKYNSTNVIGFKRKTKEMYPDDPHLLPLIREYEETFIHEPREDNRKKTVSPTRSPSPKKKPRYSIIYKESVSSEDESVSFQDQMTTRNKAFRQSLMWVADPPLEMDHIPKTRSSTGPETLLSPAQGHESAPQQSLDPLKSEYRAAITGGKQVYQEIVRKRLKQDGWNLEEYERGRECGSTPAKSADTRAMEDTRT